MTERNLGQPAVPSLQPRFLPLLLSFVGSGCSALIYEIVWFQLLQLVIGSSAVSLAVLAGDFHGRDVPGQPRLAAHCFPRGDTPCGSMPCWSGHGDLRASSCCS